MIEPHLQGFSHLHGILCLLPSLPPHQNYVPFSDWIYLVIIKKNWFLAFPDKGVKHYGSKAHGGNGHRALGPSYYMRNSILLRAGCQMSQVVTLSFASSLGVCSHKRRGRFSSVQCNSVIQSCPTLWDPMDHSTSGFPVYHQLPEFTQTHVHQVGDAIQPSRPLSSPSPPALNLSQHQGLFKWVSSSHQVAKVVELQLQHQSFPWTLRTDFL